jgi:hypothetical protein
MTVRRVTRGSFAAHCTAGADAGVLLHSERASTYTGMPGPQNGLVLEDGHAHARRGQTNSTTTWDR